MIRSDRRMSGLPTVRMTGLTVAAGSKVFTDGKAYKGTVCRVMAVGAVGKMRRCINKGICMTAGTVIRAGCRYKAAVIRRCCMDRTPGRAVTRGTVTAGSKSLTDSQADHVAVRVMTAGTGIMRICCCAGQRGVRMTGSTVGRSYSHNRRMVRCCRMDRIPRSAVTRGTVAAYCKGLADR